VAERSGYATEEQILATSGIVIMYQDFTTEVINKHRRQHKIHNSSVSAQTPAVYRTYEPRLIDIDTVSRLQNLC